MRTLIPRDIVLYVFLGGYVANSYCKLGEGAVGGQDVFGKGSGSNCPPVCPAVSEGGSDRAPLF